MSCKERVWDNGDMITCGNCDVASALTGICLRCAHHQLPFALAQREKLQSDLETLDRRITTLRTATGH